MALFLHFSQGSLEEYTINTTNTRYAKLPTTQ